MRMKEKSFIEEIDTELEEATSRYRSLWSKRFDLSQKIEMEKDLNDELKKAHFLEYEYDFTPNIQLNDNSFDVDMSIPLLKQIHDLEKCLEQENQKLIPFQDSKTIDQKSFLEQIEIRKNEIHELENDLNHLLDKMVSYEDEELHLLRAKKQHFLLQKKQ